jgi:two-component system, NtrC family, sensor histidine kinase HydH
VLRNLSLGATLTLGFASLLAMMAGVIGWAIHEVNATQAQRHVLADELLPAAAAADRLALNAVRFDDALQAFVTTRSLQDLTVARLSRAAVSSAADELERRRLSDQQDEYLAEQIETAAGDFRRQAPVAEQYAIAAAPERAGAFVHQYLQGPLAEFVGATERLGARLDVQSAAIRGQINQRAERLTRSLVVAFGLAGLVGILLAVYCLCLVTEPIGRLVLAARAVETGDYSRARHLGEAESGVARRASQNELAALARAFSHMAAALEEREQRLRAQTTHLAAANAQLTALQSLTDVALSDLPLDRLLEQLLQRVVAGMGGELGAIFLTERASGRLEPHAALNLDDEGMREAMLSLAEGLTADSAATGRVLQCTDLLSIPGASSQCLIQCGVAACLAVTILAGGQVVGVACVGFSQSLSFDPAAVNLMPVFGERVGRAIERSGAVEELESKRRELERQVAHQQDQLLRSERLVAIGLVGSSIAHELRNPLGVIKNAAYFLRRRSGPPDEKMRRHLDIIEREVQHSISIINDLVDYSTGIEPESRRLDMNSLIRSALEHTLVPATIRIDLELDDNLPTVVGDESQLLQVLEHLIRNAVQAMEATGTLTISSGASDIAVWTTVRDTGPGVAPADQTRIFEPLVTTRAKGMGLGLSLARKIAEAHGGEIRLSSQPGNGAAFTIDLPITDHLPGFSSKIEANLTSSR